MPSPKQHYVPRCLLRAFRSSGTKKPHVWCFDKRDGKISNPSVDDICAESHFYNFNGSFTFDDAFTELEEIMVCPSHKNIVQTKDFFATRDKVGIAGLVAAQHLRTRGFRNTIREATSREMPALISAKRMPRDFRPISSARLSLSMSNQSWK